MMGRGQTLTQDTSASRPSTFKKSSPDRSLYETIYEIGKCPQEVGVMEQYNFHILGLNARSRSRRETPLVRLHNVLFR